MHEHRLPLETTTSSPPRLNLEAAEVIWILMVAICVSFQLLVMGPWWLFRAVARGKVHLGAEWKTALLLALPILMWWQLLTLRDFYEAYTSGARPVALEFARRQFRHGIFLRPFVGMWLLLQAAAVICAALLFSLGENLGHPPQSVFEWLIHFGFVVTFAHVSSTYLTCAVASLTGSDQAIRLMWRGRFAIDLLIALALRAAKLA